MSDEKKQIQHELSTLIQQDIVKIATDFSQTNQLKHSLVLTLIQDISLLKKYEVTYIHNFELDDVIQIFLNQFKNTVFAYERAFMIALHYLKNSSKEEFLQKFFIEIFLKVPKEFFIDAYALFNVLCGSVKELYEYFIKYIFNIRFLQLDENIQIECIYKAWNFSLQIFHDNEASKYAYGELLKLFQQALHYEKTEVAFWLYYTPLHYYKSGVRFDIDVSNEEFKNEVEKPLEKYILETIVPKYEIIPNKKEVNKDGKIKVAFVMQRIIRHSTMNVLYSLVKALMKEKNSQYEFVLYDLAFAEANGSDKTFVEEFKQLGIKYINLHEKIFGNMDFTYSLLEKCIQTRQILIDDEIDILIGLHTRVEYIFLYATRTAPKQIYWYHSSNAQYDIQGIDFRIKHGDFKKDVAIHDKKIFLQFGDIVDKSYLNPEISKTLIEKEKSKFPKNSIIMGTIGRLSKIDSKEYIEIIDNILEKNPNTIYIAAGNGDKESIKSKIKEQTISRWFFVGQIQAHLYGNIIDIWPNTFPVPQGLSTLEFMAKGKPVLTMKNDLHDFEVQNAANLKRTDKFKEFKMNVDNIDDYTNSLELLIKSEEAREVIGKLNLDYIEKSYYDTTSSTQRFYEILEETIK